MANPCKILLASHSPTCTTGYGRVTRRLAHAFGKAGHTVAVAGLSFRGGPHELPYRIFPWQEKRPGESFAAACREFSPEVLLTIGDPWMFEFLPGLPERRSAVWVAYFPVDGRPLPQEWKPWIAAVDVPVTFCRFTQDLVAAAMGKPPELIYHGVDTKRFRPTDKSTAKKLANVAGHFVAGTVARNQQRKNLPALLKAFAKFAENKSDALLYLHTQVRAEWDLKELSRSLGIENKTRVTADLGGGSGIPDEMLATVYNAMDVFVLPTMAEGFGLPIMEAQACGVPALATDFSACSELVPDPIQRLKVKDTLVMHRNFEQAIVDVDDIAAKLEHFYREREELESLGRRCHEFAQQFEWEIACGQFVDLIDRLPAVSGQSSVVSGQSTASGRRPERSEGSPLGLPKDVIRSTGLSPVSSKERPQPGRPCHEARSDAAYAPGAQERDRVAARAHERAGRLFEAQEACRRMLVRNPDDPAALHLLGVVRGKLGDGGEAVSLLQRAIGLSPETPAMHNDLGVVFEGRGEFAEAAASYRRAVQIRPGLHQVWVNLCNALVQGGRAEEALGPCREALRLRPDYAPAHNAHGAALAELGRAEEARAEFEEAVRLRPDHAEAHSNLGLTLLRLGDFRRGWAEHEWRRKDLRRFPARPGKPWDGQGDLAGRSILLFSEGGLGNTIQFARFAPVLCRTGAKVTVECQPALVDLLRTIEGIEVTTPGQAADGAEVSCPLMSLPAALGQDPRSCVRSAPGTARSVARESVRGADPTGPDDTVVDPASGVFERPPVLAPWVFDMSDGPPDTGRETHGASTGGRSEEALRGLAGSAPRTGSRATERAVPGADPTGCGSEDLSSAAGAPTGGGAGAPQPPVGAPAALKIPRLGAIPADVPYLHPDGALVEHWANAIREAAGGRTPALRVGVCWRGDQQRVHMRDRSFDPACLRPLASLAGVVLVNLQHGEAPPNDPAMLTLRGLEPDKMRLLDVAAAMKSLDLVVTCDTSIAHLAGALGVPVWVALKASACWRWMLGREDSPWYPTMRLFRQDKPGDWATVFARMAQALVEKLTAGGARLGSGASVAAIARLGSVGWAANTPLAVSQSEALGATDCETASGDHAMTELTVRSADPTGLRTNLSPPQETVRGADPAQAPSGIGVRACVYDAKTQPGRPCHGTSESVRSADPTGSAFDYFGPAFVLNMDCDADRMARTAARLQRLGIAYQRFAALPAPPGLRPREPGRDAGAYGCALSHRAILRRALELGRERVLIFEDDVVLRDDAGDWLRRIVPQLQGVEWDVFYLGLHLEAAGERRGDNLLEVRRGYHTHAYAVARKAIPRLIGHIDRILAALAGTFDGMEDPSLLKVCAAPILAVQEPNFSRTVGRQMDRLEQYFAAFDGEDFRRHCSEMAGWKPA